MAQELSLEVKGAMFANADGSNRLFEIAMLNPGDPILLEPEPKNKVDPNAVAVYSTRGYQIGYLSAERCVLIGAKIRQGCEVRAIFQQRIAEGAIIRVNLNGAAPTLPLLPAATVDPIVEAQRTVMANADPESGFYPDFVPPDE